MNDWSVGYLLIGGMNFMLRHQPILTFDIDLWIEDTDANRARCEAALTALDAEWGETDSNWESVANKPPGWLFRQSVFSLNSADGAIDIFRAVPGLVDWQASWQSSLVEQTSGGVSYHGISDEDMLRCQMALEASARKTSRIQALQDKLKQKP
jgi:hypothetical protein